MRSNKLTLQVGLLSIFRHDRIFDELHTAIANGHKIKFRGQKERKKTFQFRFHVFQFQFSLRKHHWIRVASRSPCVML